MQKIKFKLLLRIRKEMLLKTLRKKTRS